MILAIYNCTWTPLTISFDWAMITDDEPYFRAIDFVVMTLYSIDIIVHFLTSYYNISTGDEIFKPSWIALKYLKGEFFVDFLSTFPWRFFMRDN